MCVIGIDWAYVGQMCLFGKSDLLSAPGTEAAMAGYRVKYALATRIVNELVEAADEE